MAQHPADPTPRSPADVLSDRTYKAVHIEQLANSVIKLVVIHRGSETYWQTFYKVFEVENTTQWFQVVPIAKTIVDYVIKS